MLDIFTENREKLLEYTKNDDPNHRYLKQSLQYLITLTNSEIVTLPQKGTFSMRDVLTEIQRREASIGTVDICVHPEYAVDAFTFMKEDRGRDVQEILQQISDAFQEELSQILRSSSQAIIIDAPNDNKKIGIGQRFTSATTSMLNEETGHLHTPELARLLLETTVSPDTNILFHGAEYGRCPTLAAQQLLLALGLGIAVPLENAPPQNFIAYSCILLRIMPLIREGHFRMGTLLKLDDDNKLPKASEALTQAMHCDHTRIYPYCLTNTSTVLK